MPDLRPRLFAFDLHGRTKQYRKLFAAIAEARPRAVFQGGDLQPHGLDQSWFSHRSAGDINS